MPDTFERLFLFMLTYLLGFSFIGFFRACYRERLTVEHVARRLVLVFAFLLALLFFAGVLAGVA